MTLHHFVPLSIISTFASDQAWRVIKQSSEVKAQIAKLDKGYINNRSKRQVWPIVVYDKIKKILTRRLAKNVCSAHNLYGLVDDDDPLIRGLIRYTLAINDFKVTSIDDLIQIGQARLDSDLIETVHIETIDNHFAQVLPVLRSGKQIEEKDFDFIPRFIAFSLFRTPSWRRIHYTETYENLQKGLQVLSSGNQAQVKKSKVLGRNIDAINSTVDRSLYQIALTYAFNQENLKLRQTNPKILILHAVGNTSFVTCDNPARPYFPDRLQRISTEAVSGIGNARSQITYPIDPKTCILMSINPRLAKFAHADANDKLVRKINSALAQVADKEIVFSGPNTDVFESWLKIDKLRPIKRH